MRRLACASPSRSAGESLRDTLRCVARPCGALHLCESHGYATSRVELCRCDWYLQNDDTTHAQNQKVVELSEAVSALSASAAKSELFEVQMFEVPGRKPLERPCAALTFPCAPEALNDVCSVH
jgi:hypothetical protein